MTHVEASCCTLSEVECRVSDCLWRVLRDRVFGTFAIPTNFAIFWWCNIFALLTVFCCEVFIPRKEKNATSWRCRTDFVEFAILDDRGFSTLSVVYIVLVLLTVSEPCSAEIHE